MQNMQNIQARLKIKLWMIAAVGLLFFIFLLLVFIGSRENGVQQRPSDKSVVTPTLRRKKGKVTPTLLFEKETRPTLPTEDFTTGVLDDELEDYLRKHPEVEVISELRRSMPLETENFSMDYSYKDTIFTVEIKPPYAAGRDAFLNFLKERGLASYEDKLFSISYK